MVVCIAEKPSVANDIAKVIGATKRFDGYFEGNDYQVTWTYGHLCCLKSPDEYYEKWKHWSLSLLPMIPEEFGINLIKNTGVKKQFSVIKRLFSKAEMIVNCGDAGQEGELIQRWVMQMAQVKCPVKRLWISSLTEESIRKGFQELKPQEDYDNLFKAGVSRAIGDWLLGMNATRLYTLKYGGKDLLLSLGRVQTPTLALIVNRQREIEHFKPETYWNLSTLYKGVKFQAVDGKFNDKAVGQAKLDSIKRESFVIEEIHQKEAIEHSPQLYDITTLQVECNKLYGYSAESTLNTIQSLYEKKLTTYPRVDTRYLSEDIYSQCAGIISKLAAINQYAKPLVEKPLKKSGRVFDNGKVTDHHAIIPTGRLSSDLNDREGNVFELIVKRFISVFLDDCHYQATTIEAHAGSVGFRAIGKKIINKGWMVLDMKLEEKKGGAEHLLPNFEQGENGVHDPILEERQTAPPKPYTEATLLRAMETAGQFVEDEKLRSALKQNGIGRPSSRAGIIETLFKRQYIRREKKNLVPTQLGAYLIDTVKSELLKSCELTGQWEKKLREMESGHYDSNVFMYELEMQLHDIVQDVLNDKDYKPLPVIQAKFVKKDKAIYSRNSRSNKPD